MEKSPLKMANNISPVRVIFERKREGKYFWGDSRRKIHFFGDNFSSKRAIWKFQYFSEKFVLKNGKKISPGRIFQRKRGETKFS